MKQTDIVRGLGLDSAAGRAAMADAWRSYLAPAAASVLGPVYDKCAADAGLRVFLWGASKDDWVRSQTERWSKVFVNGVDDEHIRRVEGFARDDLKSGMNPAVYGVFFGIFAASATAQILTHGNDTPAVADAVKAVSALTNVETTLAFSSYYHALREQTAETIDGLTGSLHDNVSENIAGMASATEELSATMRTIEVTVDRNTQHAQAISSTVEEVRMQINDLRKAIEGILSLLGSIKDIAGQTNLLALNATIEAARAGEAGRGFAVVAKEVKSLANDSKGAAEKIGDNTTLLQESLTVVEETFGGVVNSVSEMLGFLDENSEATAQQRLATEEISKRVGEMHGRVEQIIADIRKQHAA